MYAVKGQKTRRTIERIQAQVSTVYSSRFPTHRNEYQHVYYCAYEWEATVSSSRMSMPPFCKKSSLQNLDNGPFSFTCSLLEIISINSPEVIRPWQERNSSKVCSLYVPLAFLTSIDPPAFRPCWCMNRMKAALKEPVTDIMSPQTFIKLPFILLLRPP